MQHRGSTARRSTGMALIGIVALALAACGSSDQPGSQTSGEPASNSAAGTPAASGTTDDTTASGGQPPDGDATLNELYTAAKAEGTVVWFAPKAQDQMQPAIDAFEKAYPGIEVQYTDKKAPDQVTQLKLEESANKVTIDVANAGGLTVEAALPIVQTVDWAKYGVPKDQIMDDFVYIWSVPKVFAYNTNVVSADNVPKSWDDLLDPQWKGGKLGLEARGSFMTVWATDDALGGPDAGIAYAKKLAAQDPHFTPNATQSHAMMVSGQVAISNTLMNNLLDDQAKGAPIALAPISPITGNEAYLYVPKGAPHQAAATLLASFLASPAGQAELAKGNNAIIPPSTDCTGTDKTAVVQALCDAGIEWKGIVDAKQYELLSDFFPKVQAALGASADG